MLFYYSYDYCDNDVQKSCVWPRCCRYDYDVYWSCSSDCIIIVNCDVVRSRCCCCVVVALYHQPASCVPPIYVRPCYLPYLFLTNFDNSHSAVVSRSTQSQTFMLGLQNSAVWLMLATVNRSESTVAIKKFLEFLNRFLFYCSLLVW